MAIPKITPADYTPDIYGGASIYGAPTASAPQIYSVPSTRYPVSFVNKRNTPYNVTDKIWIEQGGAQGQSIIPQSRQTPTGTSTTSTGGSAYSSLGDAIVRQLQQDQVSGRSGGDGTVSGGGYVGGPSVYEQPYIPQTAPLNFPDYPMGMVDLSVPDFNWAPTAEQRAAWEQEAINQARMMYRPQISQAEENLKRFLQYAEEERGRINPQYDRLNLAVANVIENSVKQAVIEDAIRRGAETSGELPRQLEGAGRLEVAQRRDIENERNSILDEIRRRSEEEQRYIAGQISELRRMKALQAALAKQQLERQARSDWFEATKTGFEGELSLAGLNNAIAAQQYQADYNKALMNWQQQESAWERDFKNRQLALSQAQSNYSSSYGQPRNPQMDLFEAISAQMAMQEIGIDPEKQYEYFMENQPEWAWLVQRGSTRQSSQPVWGWQSAANVRARQGR